MVREKLEGSGLSRAHSEEVIRELAAHLEEAYEGARSRGLTDAAAVQLAWQEVKDWRSLVEENLIEQKRRIP